MRIEVRFAYIVTAVMGVEVTDGERSTREGIADAVRRAMQKAGGTAACKSVEIDYDSIGQFGLSYTPITEGE